MTLKRLLTLGAIVMTIAGTSDCVLAGFATPDSIVIVPARKRVVHLAFEIAQCKNVGVVAYNASPTLTAPLIHVWNGNEWIQISMDDYVQGSFMSGEPKHVFILGDDSMLPPQMTTSPAWCKDVRKITALDPATIINEIGKALNFSSHQWKWLAEVNGLSIKDQNAERRRYGRWGAPGKEKDFNPVKIETTELPPAPAITDTTVEKKAEIKVEPKVEVKAEAKPEVKVEPKVEAAPTPVMPPTPPVVEKPSVAPAALPVAPAVVEPTK